MSEKNISPYRPFKEGEEMAAANWLAAVRIISVLYSALVGALFPELLPCLLDLFLRSVRPYFRQGVFFVLLSLFLHCQYLLTYCLRTCAGKRFWNALFLSSVGGPWHFGADPHLCFLDPDPTPDPTLRMQKKISLIFSYYLPTGTLSSVWKNLLFANFVLKSCFASIISEKEGSRSGSCEFWICINFQIHFQIC